MNLQSATPTRHFSGRGPFDRFKTLWAAFVIEGGGKRLFFGGDSGYGGEFKDIGTRYGPFDMTFLECGAYSPYWPHIHMLPEETVKAHGDLKGQVLMPIHCARFNLSVHGWTEPVERLLARATKEGVTVIPPRSVSLMRGIRLLKRPAGGDGPKKIVIRKREFRLTDTRPDNTIRRYYYVDPA